MKNNLSLKGFVKVDVVDHLGKIVRPGRWQKNLLLNQGLNNLSTVLMADLFAYAVKGTDTLIMFEDVANTNTYTLSGTTLTRTAGARNFVDPDDTGKLIRTTGGLECIIQTWSSSTVVQVEAVGSNPLTSFTNQNIVLYSVQATGLATEVNRTNSYSSLAGENSTIDIGNLRTMKRTFLFPAEAGNLEVSGGIGAFVVNWTGTAMTRSSGARNFSADDEGKYIKINSSGDYAKILTFNSITSVTVDRPPSVAYTAETVTFYGFNSYSHIGFSDQATAGANLNVMVRLEATPGGTASPVLALGENPETPGQQVKVTYSFAVTFGPNTITTEAGSSFTDPSHVMGSAKSGHSVLEAIASSSVGDDGVTLTDSSSLEPSVGGFVALATSAAALVAVAPSSNPPDRSTGSAYTELTPDVYIADSFENTYTGTFDITNGNGTWHSFGIYDPSAQAFLFTYLFANPQTKPGTHQFTLRFAKTWNRDLS